MEVREHFLFVLSGFHVVQFLLAEGAGRGETAVENDALAAVGALAEPPEEKAESQAENAESGQQIEGRGAGGHICKEQGYDGNDAHDQHNMGGRAGDGKAHRDLLV